MRWASFTPEAERDLDAITDYIANDDVETAKRFVATLRAACARIAKSPGIGRAHDNLLQGLRTFPKKDYVILYRETEYGIDVLGVIHAARDFTSFF